jgi:hypothetical protein
MRKLLTLWIALAVAVGISASSFGGSMTLMGVGKPAAAGGASLTFTWTDSGFAASSPATISQAGKAIGTASADRFVVVTVTILGAAADARKDITAVTVDPGALGSPVTLSKVAFANEGANQRSQLVWAGIVSGGGASTTATIAFTGYTNGFINSLVYNVAVIKGSATTSCPSSVVTSAYSSGGTAATVTVPPNGVSVIGTYSDNNAATTGVTTTYNSTAADKDQSDGVAFGQTGSMFHMTAPASLTVASTTTSSFGWVAANCQP